MSTGIFKSPDSRYWRALYNAAISEIGNILLLCKIRKLRPQVTGYGSQRMCPFCGLITSRSKAHCLECGRSLTAVGATSTIEN